MDKSDYAVSLFSKGFNCSQAVFLAFSKDYEISDEIALKISAGFGGGMGRLQETCGAVTGAFMTLGLEHGQFKEDQPEKREKTYSSVADFAKRFKEKHSTISCLKLLNCDLNTESGKAFFTEKELKKNVCTECVKDAVVIVESMLKNK